MKNIFKLFILTATLQTYSCYGTMMTGSVIQQIIITSSTTREELFIISDSQSYTTGGITFTYPVGIFTLPPVVQVSVQPNAPHAASETFVAEISSNSLSATTVMVYVVQFGVVSEAPNGSVTINLLAIADPV